MLEDTSELRRLVYVADQRRARFCGLPIPTSQMIYDDDPRNDEWDAQLHTAKIAMLNADRELLEYLLKALDMKTVLKY